MSGDILVGNLPQSLEMEAAILGAMLEAESAIEKAAAVGLTGSMFERPAHRLVFEAIMELHEKGHVDEQLVAKHLQNQGTLAAAGGWGAIIDLHSARLPVSNAKAYAVEVRDTAILRSLVRRGHQIAALGYERPDEPTALITRAGQIIDEMTDRATADDRRITTLADELTPFYDEMAERRDRGALFSGLSTGIAALDHRWGGLQDGRLYVIAGRPGMGKSALGSGIAEALVFGSDADVYVPNFEMSAREQAGRSIARIGSINLHRITNGLPTDQDFQSTYDLMGHIHEGAKHMHLDECSGMTMAQVAQRARRLNRNLKRRGRKLNAIVVDYLQKIANPPGVHQEYAAVTYNSGKLKDLAMELGVPVIALAQLNRSVEDRPDKKPNMGDLRGSGAIEQDADCIALLYRPEYYLKDQTPVEWLGVAELETAKARNGRPGTDKLRWEGEYTRYSSHEPIAFVAGGGSLRGAA